MSKKNRKKIFVGMSGGVDSSVCATLLKDEGYDVTGVFIKGWYPDWQECNWRDDRRDAMRVCARLDIPFLTLDLEKEYKKGVVDYMVKEYLSGRTPNPDVMCNKEIKFGHFLQFANKMGADMVATGHYAKIKKISREESNLYRLLESNDKNKDQTYFLWTLTQNQLKKIIFPIGKYEKKDIRKIAKKYKLPTAGKKDSQGLCFIGKVDMKDFLSHYKKPKRGRVLNTNGEIIGEHNGAIFLTIGQRHGFKLFNRGTTSRPLYVVSKDIKKNSVTVAEKNDSIEGEKKTKIFLENPNWIFTEPSPEKKYKVRLRYRQKLMDGIIKKEKNKWAVTLSNGVSDASLGQSLVAYENGTCVGGGIISFFG